MGFFRVLSFQRSRFRVVAEHCLNALRYAGPHQS